MPVSAGDESPRSATFTLSAALEQPSIEIRFAAVKAGEKMILT
jgi:hypothetical protein